MGGTVHKIGLLLRVLGAVLGVGVFALIGLHWGWTGAPWLINVALAKIGLIGAGGLMAAGVVVERVARRDDARQLPAPPEA